MLSAKAIFYFLLSVFISFVSVITSAVPLILPHLQNTFLDMVDEAFSVLALKEFSPVEMKSLKVVIKVL